VRVHSVRVAFSVAGSHCRQSLRANSVSGRVSHSAAITRPAAEPSPVSTWPRRRRPVCGWWRRVVRGRWSCGNRRSRVAWCNRRRVDWDGRANADMLICRHDGLVYGRGDWRNISGRHVARHLRNVSLHRHGRHVSLNQHRRHIRSVVWHLGYITLHWQRRNVSLNRHGRHIGSIVWHLGYIILHRHRRNVRPVGRHLRHRALDRRRRNVRLVGLYLRYITLDRHWLQV